MASNDKNFVVKKGITIGQGGSSPFSLPDVDGSVNQLLKTNGSGVVTWSTLTASDVGAAASSHVHGNITNAGAIGSTTNLVVTTTTSGVLTTSSRSGIDSRSTFPPDSHTHGNITNAGAIGTTTDLVVTTTTSGVLTTSSRSGIDSRSTFPAASHVHGNITNAGAIGTTADLVVTTTTSGVLTTASRSGIDSRSTFPATAHTHPVSEVSDATTVGQNVVKLTNPSAIRFLRVNANNTVDALTDSDFRTAIGVGSGSGTVTSVAAGNGLDFTTITATGSVTLGTPGTITGATTNAVTTTSHTHALTLASATFNNGGAGAASGTTFDGTTARTISYNTIGAAADADVVKLTGNQTISGVKTFRNANAIRTEAAITQDAIILAGRAGGASSYAVTFIPTTLTGSRTITLPDVTGTMALTNTTVTLDTTQTITGSKTFTGGVTVNKTAIDKIALMQDSFTGSIRVSSLTASRSWNFPDAGGTVALDTTVVTLDGAQTISGAKTFSGIPYLLNNGSLRVYESGNTVEREALRMSSANNLELGGTANPTIINSSITPTYYNGTNTYDIYHEGNLPPSSGASGGGTDAIFWENDITVTTNYTITTNKNALTAGPVEISNGVTVTVPTGSVWTVV